VNAESSASLSTDSAATVSVCHLGKYYPPAPGGIETHVQTLASAQAELGARVRVVCINHANRAGHDVTWGRFGATETVDHCDGRVRVTRLGRAASVARFDFLPQLPQLLLDLQHSDIDVLHLHTPNPTMMFAIASLRLSVPIVVTHHSDIIKQRVLRYALTPLEQLVYRRATTILSSSVSYAESSPLLQQFLHKVEALPMGLNLEQYQSPSPEAMREARRIRRQHGQDLWLCVGRCVYYKGYQTAIEALPHVRGKLILIGHGPLEGELRALSRRLGVADRVVWWGYASQEELVGAYHAATALWFPSSHKSEAYGLVQVEAMASGLPVINTDISGSGVAWVSPHEQTGLTIPVNDPRALAAASRRLLDDPGLRQRLGEGAASRAAVEFNHRTMAVRSLDVYRRTIVRGKKIVSLADPTRPKLSAWVRETMASQV
jgi:glycosyltransferase involved in cell wall biosynthesis